MILESLKWSVVWSMKLNVKNNIYTFYITPTLFYQSVWTLGKHTYRYMIGMEEL